jgi:hypothetical protein
MKDGQIIKCKIIQVGVNNIKYGVDNYTTSYINKAMVEYIRYENGNIENFNYDNSKYENKEIRKVDVFDTHPTTIENVIQFNILKEALIENIKTFIYLNNCGIIFENDNKIVFNCSNINVSSEPLNIYVGNVIRTKSELSFIVTIETFEQSYKYTISNITTNRRAANIQGKFFSCAPKYSVDMLKDVGYEIGTNIYDYIYLPTNGNNTKVHQQRVAAMLANRNGFVQYCLQYRKSINRFKSRWKDRLNVLDDRVTAEIKLYNDEHNAVLKEITLMIQKFDSKN